MPDISIIAPFRNARNFIDPFMESVCSQTVQPREIILIDDASDDDGWKYLIDKYNADNLKFIQLDDRRFPGGARNVGVKNAIGKYVYFMDIDDAFADNTALERIEKTLVYDPDVICISFIMDFGNRKNTIQAKTTLASAAYGPPAPWAQVFKRSLYVDMPEGTLSEDTPWHFLQFDQFKSFSSIQDPIYRWNRTNRDQITHTVDFCASNSITLESYAMHDILSKHNLCDEWVSDFLRNLANMYDVRHRLVNPNVKDAWRCRFIEEYRNFMTGHFIH